MNLPQDMKRLNDAIGRINGLYQQWEQAMGINPYVMQVLSDLFSEKETTQKKISQRHKLPKQTVNNVVSALVKQGYLTMRPSSLDGRERILLLTDSGLSYAEELLAPIISLDERIAERLGAESYRRITSCLEQYGDALEQEAQRDMR